MHYTKSALVDLQPLDDRLVVLHLGNNAYYELNGTARFFLENAATGLEPAQIVQRAAEVYDVDVATLRADFERLGAELVALGILEASDA